MRGVWVSTLLCSGVLAVSAAQRVSAQDGAPEPSLARLLRPAAVQTGEIEQLEQLLVELGKRPSAHADAVVAAMTIARGELVTLRSLWGRAEVRADYDRHKQIVWAALLDIDRLEARAVHAAAVQALSLRVSRAQAEAAAASAARSSTEAALAHARESAP
jgi:hypothetical protein